MKLKIRSSGLFDDWNDNRLTNRTRNIRFPREPNTSLRKTGHGPEWEVISGELKIQLSDGILRMRGTNATPAVHMRLPLEFTAGSWNIKFRNTVSDADIRMLFYPITDYVASCWGCYIYQAHYFRVNKVLEGTFYTKISKPPIVGTEWHELCFERDKNNNFAVYVDGVEMGTFTDDWLPPSPRYIGVALDWPSVADCEWDDFVVIKW